MAGPWVQALAVPTWPRRAEGDDSEGTPALWARGLGRRAIMSDIDGKVYNPGGYKLQIVRHERAWSYTKSVLTCN